MNVPPSQEVRSHESSFESAHSEAREKDFTGSLVIDGAGDKGVAVYLDGWAIYAQLTDKVEGSEVFGKEALERMIELSGTVERHVSDTGTIEMFRTYMDYIDRGDGLLNIYELDTVEVPERTVMVQKGGSVDKVTAPGGIRIGYSPNEDRATEVFEERGIDGYALSNDDIIFFENGEPNHRREFKQDGLSILVRVDSEEGLGALECEYVDMYTQGSGTGGNVDVEFDINGYEIVNTEEGGSDGFISGLLGG
ncbi:MAG: hypothetical protein SV760_07630 [Halobacteria archaeon]|nr:hypothetical protein [Halobacteria archaeon]